jgi:hypothetical protein
VPPLLAVLGYITILANEFVLDDFHIVVDNPWVRTGIHFPITEATVTSAGPYYRPFGMFVLSVGYAIWGLWSPGFHAVALLQHVVATALVERVARRLTTPVASIAAAALFAVHPIHVDAVAPFSNGVEVLATIFCLLTLLVHCAKPPGSPASPARLGLLNLCFVLALFAKESAVTLLGAVVLLDAMRPARVFTLRGALQLLPALAIYMPLRVHAMGGATHGMMLDYFEYLPREIAVHTTLATLWQYVVLLFAPLDLHADWGRPLIPLYDSMELRPLLGLVCALSVAAIALRGLWRPNAVSAGTALFAAGMGLYLHLVPLGPLMAERFTYWPSVGFCVAVAAATGWLAGRVSSRLPWVLFGSLVLAGLALTATRCLDWSTPETLWAGEVERNGTAFAHANLGAALFARGERVRAIELLRRAVEMEPTFTAARDSLATMLELENDPAGAAAVRAAAPTPAQKTP